MNAPLIWIGLPLLFAGAMMLITRPRVLTIIGVLIGLLLTYSWLAIVLRRFPYTRPSSAACRWPAVSRRRTSGGSCTATSSRRTCFSPATGG